METVSEILVGLSQLLLALVYLMLTPLGPLLLGIIALLVLGVVLLVQSRSG